MTPEQVGYIFGSLLLPVVVTLALWRKGWRKTGVVLGVLWLAVGVSNVARRGRPDTAAFNKAFRQGCIKTCSAKADEAGCGRACDCVLAEMRGARSDAEFQRWATEHTPGGTPDATLTAEATAAGTRCTEKAADPAAR